MTTFRILTPVLVALVLFTSVVTHAPAQGPTGPTIAAILSQLADAIADKLSLQTELRDIKNSLPMLEDAWIRAQEERLRKAKAYAAAAAALIAIQLDIAADEARILTLDGEIKQLEKDIEAYQFEIDWINAWFTHNKEADWPSVAPKLKAERMRWQALKANAERLKGVKKWDKRYLQAGLILKRAKRTLARISERGKLKDWQKARDAEKDAGKIFKEKQARKEALPGLIQAVEAKIRRYRARLRALGFSPIP